MLLIEIFENAMTLVGATKTNGEVSRGKAEKIVDPKGYFAQNKRKNNIKIPESIDADWKDELENAETKEDIFRILERVAKRIEFENFNPVYKVGDDIVVWNGEDIYTRVESFYDWIYDIDVYDFFPNYEQKWNDNFWRHPPLLFHETENENLQSIMKDGLLPMDKTRGLSNRSVGSAIFTTMDLMASDGHYGDVIIQINTKMLSNDPNRPFVSQEPPIVESELRSAIAHKIGIDFESDVSLDMRDDTVILYGSVSPQYLSVVKKV